MSRCIKNRDKEDSTHKLQDNVVDYFITQQKVVYLIRWTRFSLLV